jgi:glycosyltransferase involved in cell wall biosynthesis
VPPEDVDALVAAARRLADDAGLRAALAARGRPYVAAHFDRDALGERYLAVLAGVTGAIPAGGRL